jgi:phenylacetate-CoA ligase
VLTSLTKQAFPIVRYRTRDLTALLPGTARTMRRMHKITGHCDDMIILRGVNLFPTQIEELILGIEALAPQSHCVLDCPAASTRLPCVWKADRGAPRDQRLESAGTLTKQIKNRIGVSVTVDVVEPNGVERSEGKAKRLIDRRPKNWFVAVSDAVFTILPTRVRTASRTSTALRIGTKFGNKTLRNRPESLRLGATVESADGH